MKVKIIKFTLTGLFLSLINLGNAADELLSSEAATDSLVSQTNSISPELFTVNNVWMMVCTFLVFVMHLGFATLESGLTRAKNSVNILVKNVGIISIGLLTYALLGFNLMYPGEFNGYLGLSGFGLSSGPEGTTSAYNVGYTYWTDFLFQGMFAATAATIVSGAVAERIKLSSFFVFTILYVAIIYPIVGSWQWGEGWLHGKGFHDFAGSTIVHSVGGWGALTGAIILGPRLGKYRDGKVNAIPGHNLPLATIGVFLLWLGWFGFNGGSVLSADPGATSYVLVTTCLAAAAGIMGAMVTSWMIQKKPDLSMMLNGSLAGLVGITAGADVVCISVSIIIGLIAGIIVVISVILLDKNRIDDPVGAISVHLVCGIWGTLATGIWGKDCKIGAQILGIVTIGVFCLIAASLIFMFLKGIMGLRVSQKEEAVGLDISEHGIEAYGGFQIFSNQ